MTLGGSAAGCEGAAAGRACAPVVHRHLDGLHPARLVHVAQDSSAVAQVGHPEAVLDTVEVQRQRARAGKEPRLARVLQALLDVVAVQVSPGLLEGLFRVARLLELLLELLVRVLPQEPAGLRTPVSVVCAAAGGRAAVRCTGAGAGRVRRCQTSQTAT